MDIVWGRSNFTCQWKNHSPRHVNFGVQQPMFTFLRGLLDPEDEGTMMLV